MRLVIEMEKPMPLVMFVLLVILIAQIGFWNSLGAVFGAMAMMGVFVVVLAGFIGLAFYVIYRKARS